MQVPRRELVGAAALALALIAVVALSAVGSGDPAPSADSRPVSRPNLLLITTDDQTVAQFNEETMPFTTRFFARRGTTFSQAIASPPLCCPARAGLLTGQYAHNHGVLTNDGGYVELRAKRNTLPVWLDRAGYRTALIGKYLNGYPAAHGDAAPGWDEWFAAAGSVEYFDFDVAVDGAVRRYRKPEYATGVYTRTARRFAGESARRGRPFFLWLSYNAPHIVPNGSPPCPGRRAQPESRADFRRFAEAALPRSPEVTEADVHDKGRWLQAKVTRRTQRGSLAARLRGPTKRWRCALASLRSVDRGIRELVTGLRRDGTLAETVVVLISDNGYYFGEHGIPDGKELPYEEALRVPLAIAVPPALGEPAPKSDALVSNVDVAPTLLDLAGAMPCRSSDRCRLVDGRSLLPLIEGDEPEWTADRAIPLELDDDFAYTGFRDDDRLYVEFTADPMGELPRPEIELYDLRRDPHQLDNRARRGGHPALHDRLAKLTRCAGTSGAHACP